MSPLALTHAFADANQNFRSCNWTELGVGVCYLFNFATSLLHVKLVEY